MEANVVRCKMTCERKDLSYGGALVALIPVYTGSKENEEFFKYTPNGRIELGILSDETTKIFDIGGEYYVDISKA